MHTKTGIALSALALTGASALAGELTIKDFAPGASVFVAGVDNAAGFRQSLDQTGMRDLWNEPSVQRWLHTAGEDLVPELTAGLEELGIDMDDLEWPTGALGVAAWFDQDPQQPPVVLMVADFGDNAESMAGVLAEAMQTAADSGTLELEEDDVNGEEVFSYRFVDMNADEGFAVDEFGDLPMPELPSYDQMHFARSGDYLLIASSTDALSQAIDVAGGDEIDSISQSDEFAGALSAIGGGAGAYVAVLGTPGREWVSDLLQATSPDEADSIGDMLGVLGLADIESFAMGVDLDTDDGILEQRFALRVPERNGLVALVDTPERSFTPPSFVSADAASFNFFQFDFAGLLPLVNRVIASLPPEQQQGAAMAQGMLAGLTPVFENLGPEVYTTTSYERPFSPDSEKQVWAIAMRDEQAVRGGMAGFFPMLGLQARDFMGNQIYAPAQGGMLPADAFAVGMGFGHVFIGPTASVENAMRQAGAGDGASLADDPDFQRSASVAGDQGLAFGYTSTSRTLEWTDWFVRNYDQILEAQFAAQFAGLEDDPFGGDDEFREEMLAEMRENMPPFMKDIPPLDIVGKYFGDSMLEMRSQPWGFGGRMLWLRPE